jgi:hypothetical protein
MANGCIKRLDALGKGNAQARLGKQARFQHGENAESHEGPRRRLELRFAQSAITPSFFRDSIRAGRRGPRRLDGVHAALCVNYLKATDLRLRLLLKSGNPRVEIHQAANGV